MDFSKVKYITTPNGVVNKITTLQGVVLWEKYNESLPLPNSNEIYYRSTNGKIVEPYLEQLEFNSIISNTIDENGIGKIVFKSNLTNLWYHAFEGRSNLKEIRLPNSITYFMSGGFMNCIGLEYVYMPSTYNGVIPYSAFLHCQSLKNIILPQGVSTIGESAFYKCTSLTSITIPEGCTTIEQYAFFNCESMEYIDLPSTITTIGAYAFNGCYLLDKLIIRFENLTKKTDSTTFQNIYCNNIYCSSDMETKIKQDSYWKKLIKDYTVFKRIEEL
jgi:hypothetical protein